VAAAALVVAGLALLTVGLVRMVGRNGGAKPSDTRTAFTMAGAPLPLDLGLYSSSGLPLERHELIPCPASVDRCPLTTPAHDYRFAIETRRGALPSGAVTGCGR
jgi:hypothetical protein